MESSLIDDSRWTLLGFPDVNGSLRGKAITAGQLDEVLRHGSPVTDLLFGLDSVDEPISTLDTLGIKSGAPDLLLKVDQDAPSGRLTWRPGWSLVIASAYSPDGSPYPYSSRTLLEKLIIAAAEKDLYVRAAFEYELRLWDVQTNQPQTDAISYSLSGTSRLSHFVEEVAAAIEPFGTSLCSAHTEAGEGLIELNLNHEQGLRAADDAAILKFCAREIAWSMGLHASFLAKPQAGEEGSSGHLHLSCWTPEKRNLFHAGASVGNALAPELSGAIAGILRFMRPLSVIYSPNINSYKRLVPGYFAPVNSSWSIDNRTTAIRVLPLGPESSRLEVRRPGADANPYLVLAASVASMIKGIEEEMRPPGPVEGDAYVLPQETYPRLPETLETAVREFEACADLTEMFGKDFCEYFSATRRWELEKWREGITDWERQRYDI